jgi:hypothetical protein
MVGFAKGLQSHFMINIGQKSLTPAMSTSA